MFELKKGKRIGQVLFIVEGEKTEPNLIYRVFSGIFGYQMERIYRDKTYRVFTDCPKSVKKRKKRKRYTEEKKYDKVKKKR